MRAPSLEPNHFTQSTTLHPPHQQDVPPQPGAPIATIGAGTGLGECFLTPGEGGHYVAYPSEGGHAEFPPRTETEVRGCKCGGVGFAGGGTDRRRDRQTD